NDLLVKFETKSPSGVSLIHSTPLEEIFVNNDKSRIKQIFINLILNAFKFTPKGAVTFGYNINKESEEPELICFVKDTGIGISSENHHKIFERFTKLDSFSQGTGLGLSIVKNILDLLEGKIWIESELNNGATFYFKLPFNIVKSANQKPVAKNVIHDSNKKFTILIAEDEESNFIYLNELLGVHNFKVIHAINGKEAVDLCAKNKEIGLVLMDINMPVLNGYEATKQIKKINPELPIVAQTAYTMTENKDAAKKAGFDGFLSKPIRKSDLFEWIRIFS
ncbi:MAG: response regulator, partial [Lutibacter sp.]|nr:response regulator [Lutibacter sp.]